MNNKRTDSVKKTSEVTRNLPNVLVFWCYAILFLQGMFSPWSTRACVWMFTLPRATSIIRAVFGEVFVK